MPSLLVLCCAGAEIGLAYGLVQAAAQAGSFAAFYLAPPLLTLFAEYLPSVYAVSLGISLAALACLGFARLVEVSGRGPPRSATTATTTAVDGTADTAAVTESAGSQQSAVDGAAAKALAAAAGLDVEAIPSSAHEHAHTSNGGTSQSRPPTGAAAGSTAMAIHGRGGDDGHPHHQHRRDKGAGKKHSAAEMVAARLVDGSYQGHHNKVAAKFAAEGIAPPPGAGKHHTREGRSNTLEGAPLLGGSATSFGGRQHTESTPLLAGAAAGGSRKQPVSATPLLLAALPPLPAATAASGGPSPDVSAVSPEAAIHGAARVRVETLTLAESALAVGVDAAVGGAYNALAAAPPPPAAGVRVASVVDAPAAASHHAHDDHHHDEHDDGEDPAVTEAMARLNPWRKNRTADFLWRLFGVGHVVTLSTDFWLVLGAIAAYSSAVYTFLAFGVSWLQADFAMDDDPAGRLIGIVSICSCFISPAAGLVSDRLWLAHQFAATQHACLLLSRLTWSYCPALHTLHFPAGTGQARRPPRGRVCCPGRRPGRLHCDGLRHHDHGCTRRRADCGRGRQLQPVPCELRGRRQHSRRGCQAAGLCSHIAASTAPPWPLQAALYPLLYEVIPDESFTVVYAALNSAINILLTVSYATAGALSNQGTDAAADSVSAANPTHDITAGRVTARAGSAAAPDAKVGDAYTGVFIMLIALAALGVACTGALLWRRITGRSLPDDADEE